MNKFAIYTAIVGDYDEILQPEVVDNRFDYILFSNDIKEPKVGVWQVRPINYHNDIQTKIARWVKTHPEELLSEYDCSVWMDANVRIKTTYTYTRSVELYFSDVKISTVKHPNRDDIYAECGEVLVYCLEKERVVFDWINILRKDGYPRKSGLYETNLLYRKHCSSIENMDALWWNYIEEYSRRDQLSFNYVLWKLQIECVDFLPAGQAAWNSPDYVYVAHSKRKSSIIKNDSQIQRFYGGAQKELRYYYSKIVNSKHPLLMFYMYNSYIKIVFGLKRIIKNMINGI